MTIKEFMSLSQQLNALCQQASAELADSEDSLVIQELKQRLQSLEEATRS